MNPEFEKTLDQIAMRFARYDAFVNKTEELEKQVVDLRRRLNVIEHLTIPNELPCGCRFLNNKRMVWCGEH